MRFVTKLTIGYEVMVGVAFLITFLGWEGMEHVVALKDTENRFSKIQLSLTEVERDILKFQVQQVESNRHRAGVAVAKLGSVISDELKIASEDAVFRRLKQMLHWEREYEKYFKEFAHHSSQDLTPRDVVRMGEIVTSIRRELEVLEREHQQKLKDDFFIVDITLIGSMLLCMTIAGIAVILTMISFKRSLRSGILFIEEVAKGNLSSKIKYKGGDELGILLGSLQKMGEELLYMEQQNLRTHMSRIALSAMMETSMEPLSLNDQLIVAMQIIQNIPWLKVQDKGAVFLTDERTGDLVLTVGVGLSGSVHQTCRRVESGKCLCGLAKAQGKIIHAAPGDNRHFTLYENVPLHGHYCVPIFSRGRVIGVVMLFLDAQHVANPEEEALLSTIANTLAGIIERKRMEEQLQHMAHHDMLTALPNRLLFMEHLDQALVLTVRGRKKLAVMLIDLDRFKHVNDTFGHAVGDALLVQTAQRIKSCLRASDMVSRLGGDEFAVILLDITEAGDAGMVAEKMVKGLVEPFMIAEHCCQIGASIGIAFFPEHGNDPDTLLVHADEAMYDIKEGGRNGFGFYSPPS